MTRRSWTVSFNEFGLSRQDYWDMEKKTAIRQQIVEAIADGVETPDTFLHAVALYNGEDRTVEYLILPQSLVLPIDPPADAVLSTWFEERKKEYAAPEYRKISYVKLAPEDHRGRKLDIRRTGPCRLRQEQIAVHDAETRTVEQLMFPRRKPPRQPCESLKSGTTFEKIVESQGKTMADVQLGTLSKGRDARQGGGRRGFLASAKPDERSYRREPSAPMLVRVTAINPEVVKSYEEAAPQIRKELALARPIASSSTCTIPMTTLALAARPWRKPPRRLKLKAVTIDAIDQGAKRPDDSLVSDLPELSELLRAAFASEVGVENEAVNIGTGRVCILRGPGNHPNPRTPACRGEGQGDRRLDKGRSREADVRQDCRV